MKHNLLYRIFDFYYSGFRSMTWGRKLWIIILLKLFIMFAVLRIFFFQDYLDSRFNTEQEKSNFVTDELTNRELND